MPQLNWLEQFALAAAISLLTTLESKVTNPVELASLKAALTFLESLMNVQIKKGDAWDLK